MDSISPAWLLLAVLVCSMIGRFMLIRAAWEISKPWGLAVLFVPFAPMVFRMKYKELAGEGQNWRTATMIFAVAFFAVTGSTGSLDDLWQIVPEKWRPAEYASHDTPEEPEIAASALEEPEEDDDGPDAPATTAVAAVPAAVPASPAVTTVKLSAAPAQPGFMARITALVKPNGAAPAAPAAPAALVSHAAPAPTVIASLTPPLTVAPTLSERAAANQMEFARLAAVYEGLKKERGYLRKWDSEAINSYNAEAARYKAALTAARAEQTALMKLAAGPKTVAKK